MLPPGRQPGIIRTRAWPTSTHSPAPRSSAAQQVAAGLSS